MRFLADSRTVTGTHSTFASGPNSVVSPSHVRREGIDQSRSPAVFAKLNTVACRVCKVKYAQFSEILAYGILAAWVFRGAKWTFDWQHSLNAAA